MLDLCNKYRPKHLADVYGQAFTTSFLKSVVNKPQESPRYFLLTGTSGVGKSTISRAFARDLIEATTGTKVDDILNHSNYIEIDSSEKAIQDNFDKVKDLIFSEINGYKVVLVDECHLLSRTTTQALLKVLEDFVGRIFIFLATTEKQDLFGPLVSRMMQFELNTPSQDQCVDYAQQVLELEAKDNPSLPSVSQQALQVAALNARSNLRTMLKQVEVILFQGEEKYLENYSSIWKSIEDYFFNFSSTDTDIIEGMYKYHPVQLRGFITAYFRDEILNPKASRYNQVYPEQLLPKLFASYLKLISYVTSPDDFFSFLYMFRTMLKKMAQASRGA